MKKKIEMLLFTTMAIFALYVFQSGSDFYSADFKLFAQDTIQNDSDTSGSSTLSASIENQQKSASLFVTFQQGGILMWPILFLGILGLTIIIERLFYYYKNRIWKSDTLEKYIDESIKNSDARFREELESEIQDAVQIYANKAERALALLNGIGNLAPVIGFFGTVQGMIGAFASIAAATTVNAKVVAVGIQIALITTAGGLSVAVPALAFFYFFTHLIQIMFATVDEISGEKIKHLPRYSNYDDSKDIAV